MHLSNGRTGDLKSSKRAPREELCFDRPMMASAESGGDQNLVARSGAIRLPDKADRRRACPNDRARPRRARRRQMLEARLAVATVSARAARERCGRSRSTNATSIANRMKRVWMLLQGARIKALSAARLDLPSRPRLRLRDSNAVSMTPRHNSLVTWRSEGSTARDGCARMGCRKDAAISGGRRSTEPHDCLARPVIPWRSVASNARPTGF